MGDPTSGRAGERAFDPESTDRVTVPEGFESPARIDTPVLAAPPPRSGEVRATLTVLTGLHAGRLVAVDGAPVTMGRGADADLVVDEPGVSRRHARVASSFAGGFHVEDLASTNGTFIGGERVGVAMLHGGDLLQLGPHAQVRFAIVELVEESLYRDLYESSVHDPLTHAFNRKYLGNRLVAEVARSRRAGTDVSILMIDVDALKKVNDAFGHLAGDRALCAVATRILHALRAGDILARFGGDEFVVLAIGARRRDAEALAERVRGAIEGLRMSARGQEIAITASIGVASLGEISSNDEPTAALLAMADSRMYRAKVSGRNRVVRSTPPPDEP